MQVVEELFTYWNLDQTDDELEQLEELLIVSSPFCYNTFQLCPARAVKYCLPTMTET